MTAEEVTLTLNLAISEIGVKAEHVEMKPRLLNDIGACYISKHLKKYLKTHDMNHSRIAEWVDYYNNRRYHESPGNITPKDKYAGREVQIFRERRKVKERTIRLCRRTKGFRLKDARTPIGAPVY